MYRPFANLCVTLGLALPAGRAAAQSPVSMHVSAQAIVTYTRVDPVPYDSAMAETKIEQPMVMLMAAAMATTTLPHVIEGVCGTDPRSPRFIEHFAEQVAVVARHIGLDSG